MSDCDEVNQTNLNHTCQLGDRKAKNIGTQRYGFGIFVLVS